jgi:biotin carboxyl carrier protein
MRIKAKMPSLGYDMEQGKLAAWLKGVGDRVERGEPLAEIETDKLTVEMESLASGSWPRSCVRPARRLRSGRSSRISRTNASAEGEARS